jgi:hypothetical protein
VNIVVGPTDHLLASRADGEYFGELALVEDTPRTATVRLRSFETLLRLCRSCSRSPMRPQDPTSKCAHPHGACTLDRALAHRLAERFATRAFALVQVRAVTECLFLTLDRIAFEAFIRVTPALYAEEFPALRSLRVPLAATFAVLPVQTRPLRKLGPRPDRPSPRTRRASVHECSRVCAVAGLPFVRADPRGCADAPDVAAAGRLGAAACCVMVAACCVMVAACCVLVASWLQRVASWLQWHTNVCGCKSVGVRGGVRIAQQRGAWRARTAGLVAAAWPRAAAVA